jgi:peroxiredoxin Q/BCP
MLKVGDKAPLFHLPTNGNNKVELDKLQGKRVVLYFYPKDDTPGCTLQAQGFRDHIKEFENKNTVVIGLSKDPTCDHDKFVAKYDLPFILASDEQGTTINDYGVWVEKSMYGKKYMGIERTTFLISQTGQIEHIWNKVKVDGHAQDVLSKIK